MIEEFSTIKESISRLCASVKGGKIICAVSGGSDSVALLLLLEQMFPSSFEIVVAHFDHQIRAESGSDAEWVEAFAANLGLEYYGGSDDIPFRAKLLRLNLEDAARRSRRDFFRRIVHKTGAVRVALGHTLDDQAATVLINLVRGAGLSGLSGMAEDDGVYWRPAIGCRKLDLATYLTSRDVEYLDDATNDDLEMTRNRMDCEVLPTLEDINAGAIRNISNAATLVASTYREFAESIEEDIKTSVAVKGGVVTATSIYNRESAYFYETLSWAFSRLVPDVVICFDDTQSVMSLQDGEVTNLPGRIVLRRCGNDAVLSPAYLPTLESWCAEVGIPDEVYIPDLRLKVVVEEVSVGETISESSVNVGVFKREVITMPVIIRSRRPGDRFRPGGLNGTKKLKDYFIDAKIPLDMRDRIPVVESGGEIIWIVGYRFAEGVLANCGEDAIRIAIK